MEGVSEVVNLKTCYLCQVCNVMNWGINTSYKTKFGILKKTVLYTRKTIGGQIVSRTYEYGHNKQQNYSTAHDFRVKHIKGKNGREENEKD